MKRSLDTTVTHLNHSTGRTTDRMCPDSRPPFGWPLSRLFADRVVCRPDGPRAKFERLLSSADAGSWVQVHDRQICRTLRPAALETLGGNHCSSCYRTGYRTSCAALWPLALKLLSFYIAKKKACPCTRAHAKGDFGRRALSDTLILCHLF